MGQAYHEAMGLLENHLLIALCAGAVYFLLMSLVGCEVWRLLLGLAGVPIGALAGVVVGTQVMANLAPATTLTPPLVAGMVLVGVVVCVLLFVLARPVGSFVVSGLMGLGVGLHLLPISSIPADQVLLVAIGVGALVACLAAVSEFGVVLSASLLGSQLAAHYAHAVLLLKRGQLLPSFTLQQEMLVVSGAGLLLGLTGLLLQRSISRRPRKAAQNAPAPAKA